MFNKLAAVISAICIVSSPDSAVSGSVLRRGRSEDTAALIEASSARPRVTENSYLLGFTRSNLISRVYQMPDGRKLRLLMKDSRFDSVLADIQRFALLPSRQSAVDFSPDTQSEGDRPECSQNECSFSGWLFHHDN